MTSLSLLLYVSTVNRQTPMPSSNGIAASLFSFRYRHVIWMFLGFFYILQFFMYVNVLILMSVMISSLISFALQNFNNLSNFCKHFIFVEFGQDRILGTECKSLKHVFLGLVIQVVTNHRILYV